MNLSMISINIIFKQLLFILLWQLNISIMTSKMYRKYLNLKVVYAGWGVQPMMNFSTQNLNCWDTSCCLDSCQSWRCYLIIFSFKTITHQIRMFIFNDHIGEHIKTTSVRENNQFYDMCICMNKWCTKM